MDFLHKYPLFVLSLLLKMKLFLLIISESIYRTKKVVKQKMKFIKSSTNKIHILLNFNILVIIKKLL